MYGAIRPVIDFIHQVYFECMRMNMSGGSLLISVSRVCLQGQIL